MSGGRRTDVLVIALISYRAPSPLLSSSPLPDVSVHRSLGWQWRWLQPLPPPLGKRLVEIEGDGEVDITEFDITECDVTFFQETDITESDVTKKEIDITDSDITETDITRKRKLI